MKHSLAFSYVPQLEAQGGGGGLCHCYLKLNHRWLRHCSRLNRRCPVGIYTPQDWCRATNHLDQECTTITALQTRLKWPSSQSLRKVKSRNQGGFLSSTSSNHFVLQIAVISWCDLNRDLTTQGCRGCSTLSLAYEYLSKVIFQHRIGIF